MSRYAVTALRLQGLGGNCLVRIAPLPQCDDTSAFKLDRSEYVR